MIYVAITITQLTIYRYLEIKTSAVSTGRWNQQKTEMSVREWIWGIPIKIKTHRIIGGRNAELLNMGESCSCYPELSITLTNIYQNRLFPKVGKTQKIGLLQV